MAYLVVNNHFIGNPGCGQANYCDGAFQSLSITYKNATLSTIYNFSYLVNTYGDIILLLRAVIWLWY